MAATKEKTPVRNDDDELVEIQLFKDTDKYRDDVFVSVNGQTCVVKRGVPVKIKKKFARVLQQSLEQDSETAQLITRESESWRRAGVE